MNKTTNKYSPEVRERSVRMVLDNQGQHDSRWLAILSISAKIGCAPQTLNEWDKEIEVEARVPVAPIVMINVVTNIVSVTVIGMMIGTSR